MNKNNNSIIYEEDLKVLKKSIEAVRKLDWNGTKTSKSKNKNKVKNAVHRKAA